LVRQTSWRWEPPFESTVGSFGSLTAKASLEAGLSLFLTYYFQYTKRTITICHVGRKYRASFEGLAGFAQILGLTALRAVLDALARVNPPGNGARTGTPTTAHEWDPVVEEFHGCRVGTL